MFNAVRLRSVRLLARAHIPPLITIQIQSSSENFVKVLFYICLSFKLNQLKGTMNKIPIKLTFHCFTSVLVDFWNGSLSKVGVFDFKEEEKIVKH